MFDSSFELAAVAWAAMTTVYWVCLIVGGGLLLVSTLAGGHGYSHVGGDFHADAGVDVQTDVGPADFHSVNAGHGNVGHAGAGHAHAGSLTSWFSIRFLVFFLAVFGLVGVTLTHWTVSSAGVVLGGSLVSGFLIGQGVHQLLRKLNRSSGDSTTRAEDYVNKVGRVTVRIEPPCKGEVVVQVGAGERYLPAVSQRHDRPFKVGESVAVVAYERGIAEVISREEYDFLSVG